MSFFDAAERLASIDRTQIVLDAARCLHSQDKLSQCAACFHICPVDAINIGKPPTLHAERCQSCLACLPACPVGAYHGEDDVADLLNCAIHIEDQPVEILCSMHPQPEAGVNEKAIAIQVHGCLAGLGMGAYLTLSALRLKSILPRTEVCSACEWGTLGQEIQEQAERASRFLSAWERQEVVHCVNEMGTAVERPYWNAKNPPLSRRDLFRMMARQGQIAMARAMANGAPSSERKPGRDRLRLISAVTQLPDLPADAMRQSLDDLNFASLTISEACTACGVCGRACPTQALRFEKNENEMTFSLSFSPQNCIGCDLCDNVCLPDAIHLNHAPTFEEIFGMKEPKTLVTGEMVRCERCRVFMAKREGVTLCSLCDYRRTHPFGSLIPEKTIKGSQA